ncbi:MAG: potassium transporter Kup [Proteobacteria bacterium]|nr:potassium transporter Kup [Pseudomonadota bacterium]
MRPTHDKQDTTERSLSLLAMGAIGVVYGDIGTSPLYALKEAFSGTYTIPASYDNVLGILSLIFWALTIVVSLKYVLFIMRADNRGEGGIMALMSLALRTTTSQAKTRRALMLLGIFGAALFYGDGMITPVISVLSAVEGLDIATHALHPYIVPLAILILIGLFVFQRKGTANVGALFGPIMIVWFITIAVLGLISIIQYPSVIKAVNPFYAIHFFMDYKGFAFLSLGAVVLVLTGTEALYADIGHFGKRPIQLAWLWLVQPALLLNYFGQGAAILQNPAAIANPFYMLLPSWGLYPMIILSTVATVIASQAVISGAFSMTQQAIQLGYCPRLEVTHTSEQEIGQIYLPWVNWGLFAAIIALVLWFQTSSNLAAAYGIAVTGTMTITTILAFVVVRNLWKWNWFISAIVILFFLVIDCAFFSANLVKIAEGGWFPLLMGLGIFTLFSTWKKGREILLTRLKPDSTNLKSFLRSIVKHPPTRVPGTAVFLGPSRDSVPFALLHNLAHNKVLHERVIFLKVEMKDIPHVPKNERVEINSLENNFYQIIVNYGFKDEPNIPKALTLCKPLGLEFKLMETSFFLSRETLIPKVPSNIPRMPLWREKLFISMAKNASSATQFFKIPTNRVVELGTQVEL